MSYKSGSSRYIEVATDWDADVPFLYVAAVMTPETSFNFVSVLASGANAASLNDSLSLRTRTGGGVAGGNVSVYQKVGAGVSADGETDYTTDPLVPGDGTTGTWQLIAGEFRSQGTAGGPANGYCNAWVNGVAGTDPIITDWDTMAARTITRVGAMMDGTTADATNCYIAMPQVWDLTGFDAGDGWDANIAALLAALSNGLEETSFPDPRAVNNQVGMIWEGKLRHYVRITDSTDRSDLVGTDHLTVDSAQAPVFSALNPTIDPYSVPVILSLDVEELVDRTDATITGENLEVSSQDPTLVWDQDDMTVVSATATELVFTPALGDHFFGVPFDLVVTNYETGVSNHFPISMVPYEGNGGTTAERYFNIEEFPPADNDPVIRLETSVDISVGSQVHIKNLRKNSATTRTLMDIDLATVHKDGAFSFDNSVTRPCSLDVRVKNPDGTPWSEWVTLYFENPAAAVAAEPELIGSGTINYVGLIGSEVDIDVGSQLSVPETNWNYTVQTGSLPAWASLHPTTGHITGTSNAAATTVVVIRATGTLEHVDITVSLDVTVSGSVAAIFTEFAVRLKGLI